MEASSTTLNINAPSAQAEPTKHSHKANFGRYVAGCPKCIELHPNGPEPRVKKAKAPKEPALTREQIMEMLRQHAPASVDAVASVPSNGDTLAQLVQLMLTKEGKQLKKEEEELVRRETARQDMVRITAEAEALRAANQERCGHVKDNGRSSINGQVHNDGMKHLFCSRCFKEFPPTMPNKEEMSNGIQI